MNKKHIQLRLLSLFLIVLMSPLQAVMGKTVVMGYYSEPGLMNGAAEGKVKSGYAYDYIQELASHAGWKYRYVYGSFRELYQKLLSGEIDMLPYITYTEARAREILFPDMAMGWEQFYLAAMKPGKLSESLSELQGKRVGSNKGAFHLGPFNDLLARKGVTCELVESTSPEERWAALERGEIDFSIETSTVFQNVPLHAVCEFGDKYPYYLVVGPGKKELLTELNNAQQRVEQVNSGFLDSLKFKYFKGIPLFMEIPEDGWKWLNSHESIRIGTYDHDEPYIIENEDGSISGIAAAQMALMMKSLGVKLPLEWKIYPGRQQVLEALRAGEIDCINPYYHNYSDAEKDGLVISQTVYKSAFSVLYEGQYTAETLSAIATPVTRLGASYVRDNYPQAKIVPCQDGYECIEKLEAGEATCVVMFSDALLEISAKYGKRHKIKILDAACDVCFATQPEDAGLICIINKAIPFVTDAERSAIQNRFSIEKQSPGLMEIIRTYPEYFYGTLTLVLAVILAMVLYKVKKEKELAEKQKQTEESQRLIDGVASTYNIAYKVNMNDDSFVLLRMDSKLIDRTQVERFRTFSDIMTSFAKVLHPGEKERMTKALDYDVIRRNLADKASYGVEYRVLIDGVTSWHHLNITKIDDNEIAIGFTEQDLEITKRRLEEKRYDEYFALFIIDIDTEMLKVIKNNEGYKVLRTGDSVPYSSAMSKLAEAFTGEPREFFLQLSDMGYTRRSLATDNKRTYSYKSENLTAGQWVDVTSYVILRHEDGTPAMFTLGFSVVDALATAREELQKQMTEDMQMIGGLAGEYHTLYYININEKTFKIYSLDKRIFSESEQYVKANGEPFDMLRKFGTSKLVHPDDREKFAVLDCETVKERLAHSKKFTVRFRRKYGDEYLWLEMDIVKYEAVDEEANAIALGFAIRDREIREEQEQHALSDGLAREYHTVWLMEGFGDHNMHLYRSTGVKTIRSAVQLGLDQPCYDTGIIKYIRAHVHEEDQERVIEETKFSTIERETPEIGTYVVSYRRYTDDRQDFDYHQMCYARAVAADGTVNYIFAYRDADKMLREQIAQQKQLQEALVMAQSASRAKSEFLFNMSHDVRTPMNAILGFTNMAAKHIDDKAKVMDCLNKTRQSGNLLLALINSVLDMSRIESGSAETEETAGDIYYSFTSIETTLREEAGVRDVTLDFAFGDISDRFVYADFTRCLRVFTNLITNSIKYTKAGGYVKVRCEQVSPQKDGVATYRYTIEDNGVGMSEEFQKHMFEAFSRERNSTTSGIEGTGLGLSVCKTFVDYLGGTIECDSKLGQGTRFTVTLPFKVQTGKKYTDPLTGDVKNVDEMSESDKARDFSGKRVLLVEDNELNREIAAELLEEVGLVVEEAADGSQAVARLREKGPGYYDFILMDIQMPVMNGYEATKAIRALYPEARIPIIALSANAFAEDKAASLAAGMNDHVAKPINIKKLFHSLAKFL